MSDTFRSLSPADPADEIGRFAVWDADAIAEAIGRAREAFPHWRDAGFEARAMVLRRFRDLAAERKEELAQLIAREMGKALWDARGEAALLPAKVDVTLEHGMGYAETLTAGAAARATFHPRGVLAVLGPFNFPAHLPNGHIVPALATGNSVVFKPSDLTPAVGEWMQRLWRDAGLPAGVFELVQGGAETGQALALDEGVDGVLFTGSYAVGRALREATLDQPDKLLALEMGGKNAMIVLEDADLELAAAEAALSITATTGQRCSCLSRLFVHHTVLDELQERLIDILSGLNIGPPLEEGVFMGPLVSRAAFERVQQMRAKAEEAGGERVFRGETLRIAPYIAPGLVRFKTTEQTHAYQREELFGPEAALYPIDDLEHGIAAVNDSEYGLAASIMSRSRGRFDRCVGRVRTGILNWNKGTIGASGRLPFGGGGKSGNDRPAGILATVYCTVPQSHLEFEGKLDPESLPPGFPRS
ncbi:MAG: aldehyde dehydrogenase family protein [bacterium]|nr:aldehyde dehydrogenase family protein [bacterium]MCP5070871.1 aldehyde dehydrogenase family protein [bacterium]